MIVPSCNTYTDPNGLGWMWLQIIDPRLGNILCNAKLKKTHLSQTACKLAIYKMTHGLIGVGITDSTEFGIREDSLCLPVSDILGIQKSHIWIPALFKSQKCIPEAQFFHI